MKKLYLYILLISALLAFPATALAEDLEFETETELTGNQEAPTPVVTDMTGNAELVFEGGRLRVRLFIRNNTNDIFAAHIHCGPPGVAGPVGLTLFMGSFTDPRGILVKGFFTNPDPGNACGWTSIDDVAQAVLNGAAYVNVHTTAESGGVPSGEIRGDIPLPRHFAPIKTTRIAYHDEWRKLWEDHITWTRVVIMGILDELPGTDVYVERLLQNYEDMEEALAPHYGEEAAEILGDLIKDHLTIAAEILTAANAGDAVAMNDAIARWYDNAHHISVQMSEMNPEFWSLEETEQMWVEHLDATLAEAVSHLEGRFEDEVAAYDLIHDLALEMADFMSEGVMRQFSKQFTGPMP